MQHDTLSMTLVCGDLSPGAAVLLFGFHWPQSLQEDPGVESVFESCACKASTGLDVALLVQSRHLLGERNLSWLNAGVLTLCGTWICPFFTQRSLSSDQDWGERLCWYHLGPVGSSW